MRREPSEPPPVPLILSFHQVQERMSFGVTNVTPKRFYCLLTFLIDKGIKFVSLDAAIHSPDPKQVAICFDDGYRHLLDILPRAVQEFGIKPTVFIPTAYVGRSNLWDYSYRFRKLPHLHEGEIRDLERAGVTIGSHGHSHVALTKLRDDDLEHELARSKQGLEELTGTSVKMISYPFGRVDERIREAARAAGYRFGFSMSFPKVTDDSLSIGRIAVYAFDTPFSVMRKLKGGPLAFIEQMKGKVVNTLSGGTILLGRIRQMGERRRKGK